MCVNVDWEGAVRCRVGQGKRGGSGVWSLCYKIAVLSVMSEIGQRRCTTWTNLMPPKLPKKIGENGPY